jgi:hypothetical protein
VSDSRLPKYHIDQQYAIALLGPVDYALDELTARLSLYVSRLPLSDADRDAIARGRDAVKHAHEAVHTLVAERREASRSKGRGDANISSN